MSIFSKNKRSAAEVEKTDLSKVPFARFANLPPIYKRADKKVLTAEACKKNLLQFTNSPIRMLEEAKNILLTSNCIQLKSEDRFEIANVVFSQIYPEFALWYYKYQKMESSLPESRERRTTLLACIEALEQLVIAYELYFREIYTSVPGKFKKVKDKLSHSGFRILEVLLLLQRMRALRYQKLPRTDWHNCNQVFFSMALHSALDDEYQLHGSVGIRDQTLKDNRKGLYKSSIKQMFLSIHLFGLMDVSTWPLQLFHVPDAYLDFLNGQGLKVAADNGDKLQPGWLYIDLYQDEPLRFERAAIRQEPSILVDYSLLFNTLVKDHEEIGKMKFISDFNPQKLSRPLQKFNEELRVPVLELMLMALQTRNRKLKRYTSFADETMKVYFGKKDVLHLLTDLTRTDVDAVMRSRQFVDTLAQQSALLSYDDNLHMRTNWRMVNFSTGGMLIHTTESSFNHAIQLGQLMAMVPSSELKTPTLGVVVRLQRQHDGFVEVAIHTLSNRPEIGFIFEEKTDDARGRGVIVYQSVNGNWYAVFNSTDNVVPGTPFWLIRPKVDRVPVRLGNVYMSKKEFVIFELRSPGMK
ncbi:MAG: hypothetical protein OEY89_01225 [Gammaproteobacteria bacterium]|nr:hypothetical protein [Gammaproteobacteria bacterium]